MRVLSESDGFVLTEDGLYRPSGAIRTHATFLVFDGNDGACLDGWETKNLVVDDGKSIMLGQLFGQNVSSLLNATNPTFTYPAPMNSLGVGDNSTAAATTNTQIGTSNASAIAIASYTMTASSGSGAATALVTATWGTGSANFSWNDWGILNGTATSGGKTTSQLFDRSTFGAFAKTTAVSIQLSVTLSQA